MNEYAQRNKPGNDEYEPALHGEHTVPPVGQTVRLESTAFNLACLQLSTPDWPYPKFAPITKLA